MTTAIASSTIAHHQRGIIIFTILWFAALASGGVMYFHNLQHAREDAAAVATAKDQGLPIPAHHEHDDTNCPIHAQIHMPVLAVGWASLLICLGLWVAFVSLLSQPLLSQALPHSRHCRGPPLV